MALVAMPPTPSKVTPWSWWAFYLLLWPSHETAHLRRPVLSSQPVEAFCCPLLAIARAWGSVFRFPVLSQDKSGDRNKANQGDTTLKIPYPNIRLGITCAKRDVNSKWFLFLLNIAASCMLKKSYPLKSGWLTSPSLLLELYSYKIKFVNDIFKGKTSRKLWLWRLNIYCSLLTWYIPREMAHHSVSLLNTARNERNLWIDDVTSLLSYWLHVTCFIARMFCIRIDVCSRSMALSTAWWFCPRTGRNNYAGHPISLLT